MFYVNYIYIFCCNELLKRTVDRKLLFLCKMTELKERKKKRFRTQRQVFVRYQNRVIYSRHWMTSKFCLGNGWQHPGSGWEKEDRSCHSTCAILGFLAWRYRSPTHSPILSLTQTIMAFIKLKRRKEKKIQKAMQHLLQSNHERLQKIKMKSQHWTFTFWPKLNICWTHQS